MSAGDLKQIFYQRAMIYLEQVLMKDVTEPWLPKIANHMAEVQLYVHTLERKIEQMKGKRK